MTSGNCDYWTGFSDNINRRFLIGLLCLTSVVNCVSPRAASSDHMKESLMPKSWRRDEFPNPQENLYECGRRGRISWVCDPNNITKYTEANRLDAAIERLRNSTGCPCTDGEGGDRHPNPGKISDCLQQERRGYILSVAIVPSIKSDTSENFDDQKFPRKELMERETIMFGDYLRRTGWHFGSCNEDIVIVLNVMDQQLHTSTGKKARRHLTQEIIKEIFHRYRNTFTEEKYTEGLELMINAYKDVLLGQYKRPSNRFGDIDMGLWIGSVSIVVMILTIAFIVCIRSLGPRFRPKRPHNHKQHQYSAAATPAMNWMNQTQPTQL